jgi:hypothetical protein
MNKDICPKNLTCQNTAGGFLCMKTCGAGYTFDVASTDTSNECIDINECMTDTHTCKIGMRCENFPGSFRCIREKPCGTGYYVNMFTQECEGKTIQNKIKN